MWVCICTRQESLTPTDFGSTYQGLNKEGEGGEGSGYPALSHLPLTPITVLLPSSRAQTHFHTRTHTSDLDAAYLWGQKNYEKANHVKKNARVADNCTMYSRYAHVRTLPFIYLTCFPKHLLEQTLKLCLFSTTVTFQDWSFVSLTPNLHNLLFAPAPNSGHVYSSLEWRS